MKKSLLFLAAPLLAITMAAAANEPTQTVKLDSKTYIPEITLARKVNPITAFLYIGSWEAKVKTNAKPKDTINPNGKVRETDKPLCHIDATNNSIILDRTDTILENCRTRVVTRSNVNAFLDTIKWGKLQVTHYAFKVNSPKQQQALIEIYANSRAAVFQNGKLASEVIAGKAIAADGIAYLPILLEQGENIINIKQMSSHGKPQIQLAIRLDQVHDLSAAWQSQNSFLNKLVYPAQDRTEKTMLDWDPNLGNFTVSVEVSDIVNNKVAFQKQTVRRGRLFHDGTASLAPGIYEIVYRTQHESQSETFVVGNPRELFNELKNKFAAFHPAAPTELDIQALYRRAQVLLKDSNYRVVDRKWQEKIIYTFSSLATILRKFEQGITDVINNQPGLHVRAFPSKVDNSTQYYRLYVPKSYEPGTPMRMLVMIPPRVSAKKRPFIEGPVMANHRDALVWSRYAEKHGFALLWPGYRSAPEGNTYESIRIEEAIEAVEKDYNIDSHQISVFGSCSAGYMAGRLVSEYSNRFAAIIYDRPIYDNSPATDEISKSYAQWCEAIRPSRHILDNKNLNIFIVHDNSNVEGHGPVSLTQAFLEQAKARNKNVVSNLGARPPGKSLMDMVFSWAASSRIENPDTTRSALFTKAGYIGPVSEAFNTPILIVEGTRTFPREQKNVHHVAESIRVAYKRYFHGADCVVKKDTQVTQEDLAHFSLILVGNPQCNSVWTMLQSQLPITVTDKDVLYKGNRVAESSPFELIVNNPRAPGKYVVLVGAADLRSLRRVTAANLFEAWYDCKIFDGNYTTTGKLDAP